PKEDLKGITTRSGIAYQGPMIPTTSSSLPQVVERETEVTKDTVPPTNNGSTKDVQPLVVQAETPIENSKPVVAHVSALKPYLKPSIPYPSRLHDQKLRDKANDQKEKFFQIFKDLDLNISFSIKVNRVIDDALRLYLFPHFLTHHATDWFDRFPRKSIHTFDQMAKIFLGKYFPPSMVTKLRNEITNFHQRLLNRYSKHGNVTRF
nr:reverse transcriptase domain-containing protein [Tanacetum cinerariifolium]